MKPLTRKQKWAMSGLWSEGTAVAAGALVAGSIIVIFGPLHGFDEWVWGCFTFPCLASIAVLQRASLICKGMTIDAYKEIIGTNEEMREKEALFEHHISLN